MNKKGGLVGIALTGAVASSFLLYNTIPNSKPSDYLHVIKIYPNQLRAIYDLGGDGVDGQIFFSKTKLGFFRGFCPPSREMQEEFDLILKRYSGR